MKLFASASLLVVCMSLMAWAAPTATAPATSPATQPSGEAVKGLKLSISADKTDLKMTPINYGRSTPDSPPYSVETTKLTLTFKNVSDKPIKLDLYDYAWRALKIDITGPDDKSVRVEDLGKAIEREMMSPTEKNYPSIDAGKSLTLTWEPKFPGRVGGMNYTLLKPGEYKLKITYTPEIVFDDRPRQPFATGTWSGSITSNEITLKCVVPK